MAKPWKEDKKEGYNPKRIKPHRRISTSIRLESEKSSVETSVNGSSNLTKDSCAQESSQTFTRDSRLSFQKSWAGNPIGIRHGCLAWLGTSSECRGANWQPQFENHGALPTCGRCGGLARLGRGGEAKRGSGEARGWIIDALRIDCPQVGKRWKSACGRLATSVAAISTCLAFMIGSADRFRIHEWFYEIRLLQGTTSSEGFQQWR